MSTFIDFLLEYERTLENSKFDEKNMNKATLIDIFFSKDNTTIESLMKEYFQKEYTLSLNIKYSKTMIFADSDVIDGHVFSTSLSTSNFIDFKCNINKLDSIFNKIKKMHGLINSIVLWFVIRSIPKNNS